MKRSKEDRQRHIDLGNTCIEIGGGSKDFRGLLAHFVRTRIFGRKDFGAQLCHACHNSKCSNPKHLYWGNAKENRDDLFSTGWTFPKRGPLSEDRKRNMGIGVSMALKGKKKSQEHRTALSLAAKKQWERQKNTPC